MPAAFVAVVSKRGGLSPGILAALINAPAPSGLQFAADHHATWVSRAGTVAFGGWAVGAPSWNVDDTGVAATLGYRLADDDGVFSAVEIAADGTGHAFTDPLAMRDLYVAENDNMLAVATRAELAAMALAEGSTPARDALATCWLAYAGHWVGGRTGFEGVRRVAPGARVVLGSSPRVEQESEPWWPEPADRGRDEHELLDEAYGAIAGIVHGALNLPADRYVLDLTGGKDSRLVLGVLVAEQISDRFTYRTVGPPDLADVQVASELCRIFDLEHEVEFDITPPARPYWERVTEFVATTGGMANVWDLRAPTRATGAVHVTGLLGEMLRAHLQRPLATQEQLVRRLAAMNYGRLALLRPHVQHELACDAEAHLTRTPGPGTTLLDQLDAFYLDVNRFSRFGPLADYDADHRIAPLGALGAVRAAFALGDDARRRQLIHRELMRRGSEQLPEHRFAGPGWPEESAAPQPPAAKIAKSEPLMARLQRKGFAQRRAAFETVLADTMNPAWEHLDRSRAIQTLDEFETLNNAMKRQLYGAITVALWLG